MLFERNSPIFARSFMKPISEFFPFLQGEPRKIVITMHQKPDPDAMGSSLGLKDFLLSFGHQITVISPTNWPEFLNWMPGANEVLDFEAEGGKSIQAISEADIIFCLDFNALYRTKHLAPHIEAASATIVLIDHHQQPQTTSFHYGISDTAKSSTSQMVYDFIINSGFGSRLSIATAECLYAGVMSDTGSFRFESTSADVHRMIAHLKDLGLEHFKIHELIYDNYHENRLRFIGHVLSHRMEIFYEYNTALIAITKKDLLRYQIKTGDSEGLVNFPLSIKGIQLAALVIDRDEERKWSFRSKGNFNTNEFARKYFNGGGHFNASGGKSDESLEATVERFKKVIKEVNNQQTN